MKDHIVEAVREALHIQRLEPRRELKAPDVLVLLGIKKVLKANSKHISSKLLLQILKKLL